jgi:uncharacterized protein
MIEYFLPALALCLLLEALLPFISPEQWRKMMTRMLKYPDQHVRLMAFAALMLAVCIMIIVHQFIWVLP